MVRVVVVVVMEMVSVMVLVMVLMVHVYSAVVSLTTCRKVRLRKAWLMGCNR